MKKYIIVFVLFAVASVVSAVETTVLKYAPDTAAGVAEVNVAELLKHPSVQKTLNKPEVAAARSSWEKKSGVRLADFEKVVFFIGADGNVFSCICVDKGLSLEKIFEQNSVKFKKLLLEGKTVYQLTETSAKGQTAELAEIAPGVILVGEKGRLAGYFGLKCGNAADIAELVRKIPPASVWLAFINRFKNASGAADDPQQLFAAFRFAGKNQKDLELQLKLFCSSPESAQMIAGAIPMYSMMGLAFVFSADPELSSQIAGCIKPVVKGDSVLVSIKIGEALVEKITAFLEQNSDRLTRKFSGKKAKKRKNRQSVPAVSAEQ